MRHLLALFLVLLAPLVATAQTTNSRTQGQLDDTSTVVCSEDTYCVVRVTTFRALHVNPRNSSGTEIGTAAAPIRTDPTGSTPQPVSGTVIANAGSGTFTNQQSNVTLDYDTGAGTQTLTIFGLGLPASGGAVAGGTATNPIRTDPTGATTQPISGTVTNTPPLNQSVNVSQIAGTSTVTGGVAGLQAVGGNAASAAADSGNPIKVGGVIGITLPTAGTDGQRMNEMVDKFGRPVIVHNADRGLKSVCSAVTVSTTTETTLCAAGGVGVFLDLEHLSCSNTSATLVRVDVRDATAGTVRKSMALAASGGGFEMNLESTWPQTTANNNWTIQLSAAVTDVRCQAVAVKNK